MLDMTIMSLKDKQIHQESLLWTEARRRVPMLWMPIKTPYSSFSGIRITLLPPGTYSQFPMTFGIVSLLEIQRSHQAINWGRTRKFSCLLIIVKEKCKVLPRRRKSVQWCFSCHPNASWVQPLCQHTSHSCPPWVRKEVFQVPVWAAEFPESAVACL